MHGGRRAKRANAQRAGFQVTGIDQLLRHGGRQCRHLPGPQQQALAGVGHGDTRGIAPCELHGELRLQRAQRMADGRLRGPQPHGRTRKAAALGQGNQHLQLGQGHDE